MEKLIFFKDIDREMGDMVGGKGANLGEMTRGGFLVPNGFCLTTAVYADFIEDFCFTGLTPREIRKELTKRPFPGYLRELLKTALKAFGDNTCFSVRSSATAEDLVFASFAGQQDTYLNVPLAGLEEAIRNCFASLFTDRAVAYRQQHQVDKALMAVVVQEMVFSEASGILFTADPVSGKRHQIVIDAGFGLGEALVSGLVTPDQYVYDQNTRALSSKTIALKQCAIRSLPGGGTEKVVMDSREPVLADAQVKELAEIGKKLECHYGYPQDVEWALYQKKFYILQTRPITSLFPIPPAAGAGLRIYLCGNYIQMYLDPMPALAQDIFRMALRIGDVPHEQYDPPVIRLSGGRLFMDITSLLSFGPARKKVPQVMTMADTLMASAVAEICSRKITFQANLRFGDVPKTVKKAVFNGIRRYHKGTVDDVVAQGWVFGNRQAQKLQDALDQASDLQGKLDAIYENCSLLRGVFPDMVQGLLPGVLSARKLAKMEQELLGSSHFNQEIGEGLEGNVTTEMGLELGDLADFIQGDSSLLREFENPDYLTLIDRIKARQDRFSGKFEAFMKKYGFRGNGEINIAVPRWQDDPTPLAKQLLGIAGTKPVGAHRQDYAQTRVNALQAADAFIAEVQERHGKRKAATIRKYINVYRDAMPLREFGKYMIVRNFGMIRAVLLEIGEAFTAAGRMNQPDDLFYLSFEEVYQALSHTRDLHDLVTRGKAVHEHNRHLTPPRVITSEGESLMGSYKDRELPGGALPGVGVSAGVVEGRAKVILDPRDGVVEHGEILVAPFTDPGWTTLFINAEGLVTEIGGMLTHGALVAREYGMPGVVGVTDATKKITTGQRIRVDGSAGYVELLE
jgi:pyruvate,water dikinase